MFFAAKIDPTRLFPRPGEGPIEYWTSLSPMAPLFGVPWRFADIATEGPAPRRASKPQRSAIRKDVADAELVTEKAPGRSAPAATPANGAAPHPAPAKPAPAKPSPVEAVADKPVAPRADAPKADAAKADASKAETAKPEAAKVEAARPEAVKAAPKAADDLTQLKGVGPKMAANLNAQGVSSFADIAAWDDARIDQMDEALGGLPGRIRRDDWVGQAKALIKG
ncbi:helix-hairpin-helix domain-containing protein [Halovulum marinum]|nr:helix-hairpin-helix domain-containing protein [Halovulum marinum]